MATSGRWLRLFVALAFYVFEARAQWESPVITKSFFRSSSCDGESVRAEMLDESNCKEADTRQAWTSLRCNSGSVMVHRCENNCSTGCTLEPLSPQCELDDSTGLYASFQCGEQSISDEHYEIIEFAQTNETTCDGAITQIRQQQVGVCLRDRVVDGVASYSMAECCGEFVNLYTGCSDARCSDCSTAMGLQHGTCLPANDTYWGRQESLPSIQSCKNSGWTSDVSTGQFELIIRRQSCRSYVGKNILVQPLVELGSLEGELSGADASATVTARLRRAEEEDGDLSAENSDPSVAHPLDNVLKGQAVATSICGVATFTDLRVDLVGSYTLLFFAVFPRYYACRSFLHAPYGKSGTDVGYVLPALSYACSSARLAGPFTMECRTKCRYWLSVSPMLIRTCYEICSAERAYLPTMSGPDTGYCPTNSLRGVQY